MKSAAALIVPVELKITFILFLINRLGSKVGSLIKNFNIFIIHFIVYQLPVIMESFINDIYSYILQYLGNEI